MCIVNRTRVLGLGIAIALAGASCQSANNQAMDKHEEEEGPEVKMKIEQAPDVVRATIAREAEGATVTDVDKESKHDKTIYEADAVIGGTNYEIKVGEDGKLISKKIDDEADEKKGDEKDEKEEKGEKN